MSQNVIDNDGSDAQRRESREGFADILRALGIQGRADIAARCQALEQLLPEIMAAAEGIIEANPLVERD
jgi:hypothetical protein